MVKGSIYMPMEATIMGIGLRGRWRGMANCMILITIYNMRENGRMTIIMGKGHCMDSMMAIGLSMSGR
jgi:hypothetical protein